MDAGLRLHLSKPIVMPEPLIQSVSDTAFWIAHLRAIETERADALFRDPLAGRLAGERGLDIARSMPMSRMIAWTVAIRTCIIDTYIRELLAEGRGREAAALLGRVPSIRGTVVHGDEADYPQIIEYKENRTAGRMRCHLSVKIDLADPRAAKPAAA